MLQYLGTTIWVNGVSHELSSVYYYTLCFLGLRALFDALPCALDLKESFRGMDQAPLSLYFIPYLFLLPLPSIVDPGLLSEVGSP